MARIRITVKSDDTVLTGKLVKFLSTTPFKSTHPLEIVSTDSVESVHPLKDSVFSTQHQTKGIFFYYQFDDITQKNKPDEQTDLEYFAKDYSDFAVQAMMHNDEFKNLFSNDLSSAIQTNATNTNTYIPSTSHNPSFFYPTSKYASYHQNNADADNKTGAFFALGLGFCAVSGILFIFAPLPLAITTIILTIALLGIAVFYNELKGLVEKNLKFAPPL